MTHAMLNGLVARSAVRTSAVCGHVEGTRGGNGRARVLVMVF